MALARFAHLRASPLAVAAFCHRPPPTFPRGLPAPLSRTSSTGRVIREHPAYVVPLEHYDTPSDDSPVTAPTDPTSSRLTLKDIPPATRHLLSYKGRKLPVQIVIGKKGVDTGVLNCLMLHFRRHEVVKIRVTKQWNDNVADIAAELEARSEGIVIERAGRKIILFRGLRREDVPEKTPRNETKWWDRFPSEQE